ncbi:L-tyrosine/L-tryptophan isonitrile synthase family protein [Hymenobacter jeollabukensis]|uniref:L-tyrosine/L-tryptophan isonitrile synthase family protein n=1 Tax=Hymenobacter jeollabukensis TaxID=2025313 RepID=UPI00148599BD|nr:L-tyrosine/L-tryptophan isonitrile synthase family protein [Hymenobacter jeollabukensis]
MTPPDSAYRAAATARRRLLDTGLRLFAERGYHQVTVADIAAAAGQPLAEAYRFFGSKTDFVLGLYQRIHDELEARAADLPAAPLAERFRALLQLKLRLLAPHRPTLRALAASLIDAEAPAGVLSPDTESIRLRGLALFEAVVQGAADAPAPEVQPALVRSLYAAHWGVLLLALLDRSPDGAATQQALDLISAGLSVAAPQLGSLLAPLLLGQVSQVVEQFLQLTPADFDQARQVIKLIMRHRKVLEGDEATNSEGCAAEPCAQCLGLHLPRLQYFISQGQPIHLILPAFPAKSPNRQKVLGPLPDLGEEIALTTLQSLCDDIRQVYAPGARLSICADGRVFADLVQVSDEEVSAYNHALKQLIERLGTRDLDVVNLEDLIETTDFDAARQWITAEYAEPLAELQQRVRESASQRAMFNGIHRFVAEDGQALAPEKSKSRVKEESKAVAYEVIRRSNAWTRLLAQEFPHALRLSIHPQHPHADKIGLRITRAVDNWLTPWHGVVLLRPNDYLLMKRQQAEALGATLVAQDGRPSHFVTRPES